MLSHYHLLPNNNLQTQTSSLLSTSNNSTSSQFHLGNFQLPIPRLSSATLPSINLQTPLTITSPNPLSSSHSSSPFTLSVLPISQNSQSFFHLSSDTKSLDTTANISSVPAINSNNSTKDFLQDTSTTLISHQVPTLKQSLAKGTLLLSTASAGHELAKNIQRELNDGKSTDEAIACQTAKTLTKTGIQTGGAELMMAGLPLYLAESVAFPPLALTIPIVGSALPKAYENLSIVSQTAGNLAESACHNAFAFAKSLTKKGGKP